MCIGSRGNVARSIVEKLEVGYNYQIRLAK